MTTNKQIRLEEAASSLAMAQKMLENLQARTISHHDISRVQDVATQATQAAQQLNQLVGLLLAEFAE
ncbi:hypothetical protein [Duganella vulcania]|uniref:Uncharacterized protein n=1 Tax=Duganella vulcania TaxID=2692166 RepID=A0A845GHP4_9BURK|nr:hypothetical protein [Duganella vulcania]MYM92558.1 hypothetical protein [Duganella vulcania]